MEQQLQRYQFYLKNCCSGNELFVELGFTAASLKYRNNDQYDQTRNDSQRILKKKDLERGSRGSAGPHEILNGKNDFEGEVIEEELKHEMKDSQKQLDLLKQWVIVHFKRIGITKDQSIQKSDITRTSIDDQVTRGKQRNIHNILPKYNSYLLKKKSHYQTNH